MGTIKRRITAGVSLIFLLGCTGGDGGDAAPVPSQPSNSSTQCDGDVSFNTTIPADVPSDPVSDDSSSDSDSNPGIGNPAVSKVLAAAEAHGLRVASMEEKLDGSTIVVTCGGTVNIGGDTADSNNTSAPAAE